MTNPNQGQNRSAIDTPEVRAQAERMNAVHDAINMSHDELALEHVNLKARLEALEAQAAVAPAPEAVVVVKSESRIRNWASKYAPRVGALVVAASVAAGFIGSGNSTDRASAKSEQAATKAAASPAKAKTFNSASTIAGTVDDLNINNSTSKRVSTLKTYMGTSFKKEQNNIHNKMNAMPSNSTKNEMMVAAGLAMASDSKEGTAYGHGAVNFNSKNNRDINADTNLTPAQEEAFNKKFMLEAKCHIDNDFSGTVENGYMLDGGKMASQVENFQHERVLICESKDNGTLMFKITRDKDGKICLNLIRKVETPAPAPKTEAPAAKITTKTPFAKFTTPKPKHEDIIVFDKKPEEKKPEEQKPEEKKPEEKKPEEKKPEEQCVTDCAPTPDKDDLATGTAGQNGGTPDVASVGPAGQAADAAGFVPGETHPATPAPEPTPAPIPESGPEPTAPAQTGDLTPPTTPPVVGAGAEAPTPTTDVVIQ